MNQTVTPSNVTAPSSAALNNITIFIHCMICVLGVVGNGLVIYVTGFRMKTTVNTVWFLNLAVADFLFTLFLIFNIINELRSFNWPFGDFMCKMTSLLTVLNMFASIFLLTAISLDRCLSTWVVVWARTKRTVKKAKVICLLVWLASIGCSLPLTINRKTVFYPDTQKTLCEIIFTNGLETYKKHIMFRFVVGFLIPFIIIFGSYLAIGIKVRRLQRINKLKPFRIILAVILAFFICWLPFYIYYFAVVWMHELKSKNPSPELTRLMEILNSVGLLITSLAYLNSCLNPFLYVFMCEEFKKKLKQSVVRVFESAFAEDHLALLVSQHSVFKSKSHSQSGTGTERTYSSTLEG